MADLQQHGPAETRQWLERLYTPVDQGWLNLFAVDRIDGTKHLRWFTFDQLAQAADEAALLGETCCVWFGVASRTENLGGRRGGAEHCAELPALWVDLDVADPVHNQPNLPPDLAAAAQLIVDFPLPPTVVIDSGHGLQAWWVFDEALTVDDRTKTLLADWGATWQDLGRRRGWHVDNVFDVARVMRLPGTVNRKAEPRPVEILDQNWDRSYGFDDIEQFLIEAPIPEPTATATRAVPYIGPERPGDAFNAVVDGCELLERYGFHPDHADHDGNRHYRAPHRAGRSETTGATVYADDGHITIWSETYASRHGMRTQRPYDPFGFYTHVEHGGDWAAATRALRAEGYGSAEVADLDWIEAANTAAVPAPMVGPRGNLLEEFWAARPELTHIRDAAHARARSADAVLAVTLARIAALTPPTVRLPAPVGTPGTLDLCIALVGHSGTGKSSSTLVGAELVPLIDHLVVEVPLGSGEGIVEAYMDFVEETGDDGKTRKVKRQVRQGVLAHLDEGQALAEMGSRKGATLMPTIRSAWSGGPLGQANASEERKRILPAGVYRFALIAGFQTELATALIDDAAGGTPQRFWFAAAEDPSIPDEAPEWPGPLDYERPQHIAGKTMGLDPDVAAEIRLRALSRSRGEVIIDPLDSHRDLLRLKIAGLLAVLAKRLDIDAQDWELAGTILSASDTVRGSIVEAARLRAREAEREATAKHVRREAAVVANAEQRTLERMAANIGRRIHAHAEEECPEGCTKACATRAVPGRDRGVVTIDEAIAEAAERGWVRVAGRRLYPGDSRPVGGRA